MRQFIKWFIYTIMGLAFLATGLLFFAHTFLDINLAVVYSGSMEPAMPEGALAVMESVNPFELEVDDIIAFNTPQDQNIIVSHRVVEVLNDDLSVKFRTKGDANDAPDLLSVPVDNVLARVKFNIPSAGYIMANMRDYNKNRLAFAFLMCLPTLLLVTIATREMNFMLSPEKRRARQRKKMVEQRKRRRFH